MKIILFIVLGMFLSVSSLSEPIDLVVINSQIEQLKKDAIEVNGDIEKRMVILKNELKENNQDYNKALKESNEIEEKVLELRVNNKADELVKASEILMVKKSAVGVIEQDSFKKDSEYTSLKSKYNSILKSINECKSQSKLIETKPKKVEVDKPKVINQQPIYQSSPGTVQVKGYYKKDGTYVQPYTRSKPSK